MCFVVGVYNGVVGKLRQKFNAEWTSSCPRPAHTFLLVVKLLTPLSLLANTPNMLRNAEYIELERLPHILDDNELELISA